MELFQLHYFLAVAKTQHVTKSAQTLHISQSALTQAMHKLESELGVPLFTHTGRNIALTAYGSYLYQHVQPIMAQLERLPEQLQSLTVQEPPTVRLNILAAWSLVTEAIMEYQRIDDELNIELIQNETADACDISVETRLPQQGAPRTDGESAVITEQIFLAVPNIPRYQGKTRIALSDVQHEKFITLDGSKNFHAITQHICEKAGVHLHVTFKSDSPTAVKNMTAAQMGVGFWPAFSWGAVNPKRVLLLPIDQPHCTRDIVITYHPAATTHDNMHARLFYEFLKNYFLVMQQIAAQRCR